MDSLRALMSLDPILMSLAQDVTNPHRAMSRCRSREFSSKRSAIIGTSCVGATFQLGGGSLPSATFASK